MNPLRELLPVLRCPDDAGALREAGGELLCAECGRRFPVTAGNVVELLPLEATVRDDGSAYAREYWAQRRQRLTFRDDATAWGAPEGRPAAWVARRERQVEAVRELLEEGEGARGVLCDFSAGAGYYTLAYAAAWRHVVHCDLAADALVYARRKAERMGLGNVLFVRMDYLRPPFRGGLDRVICMDSLIRGEEHERRLLAAIQGALRPGGAAVVDFHNWWHNPVRRLGLLRNNFGANRSYAAREARRLLAEAGVRAPRYVPFHQETAGSAAVRAVLRRVLPPTRLVYRFGLGEAHAAT